MWRPHPSVSQRRLIGTGLPPEGSCGWVEVQAPRGDTGLIRALAQTLHSDPEKAEAVRASVRSAVGHPQEETALDVFGPDLPDEAFKGVFTTARDEGWREVNL